MPRQLAHWSFAVCCLLAFGAGAQERQSRDFGGYIVYYNAVLTEALAPSAARAHGIERGEHRGLLNVAVEQKTGERPHPSVRADVRVRATNLAGQLKSIEMRPVESGPYVYYVGSFPVAPREVIDFEIDVHPESAEQSYRVQFERRFVTAGP